MPTSDIKHPGHRETCRLMRQYVELYHDDALWLKLFSLDEVFDYIEKIPYAYDREIWGNGVEGIVRPARFRELPGLDCKKKAILVGCWARCNGLQYKFVAVDDTGRGITHVFAAVEETPGNWVSMDCTVEGLFRPGSPMKNVVYAEEF